MMKRATLALFGASLTAACMPLEQAALVYSSKQQMGVGVAVATPDTPGFDVNIGYKGLDAAYVPVAVAKYCNANKGACGSIDHNLRLIAGKNDIQAKTSTLEEDLRRAEANLKSEQGLQKINQDTLEKRQEERRAIDAKAAAVSKRTELEAIPQQVDALGVAAPLPPDRANQITALTKVIDGADALIQAQSIRARNKEISDLQSTKLTIDGRIAGYEGEIKALKTARLASAGDVKDDALSVYGTFEGNATGDKNGAGLALGKVFSTGVAAQNLSQGVGSAARTLAVGRCFESASKLMVGSSDEAKRAAMIVACATGELPKKPSNDS